jgi:hypothetical protein
MPQIIVTADRAGEARDPVMLRERVNVEDFQSDRFAANLLERLGWAVLDAAELERRQRTPSPETLTVARPKR